MKDSVKLVMTNEEICRDYRTAAAPLKQIQILADLNGCGKGIIKQILIDGGEKLPGNMMPKPKKQPEPPQAPDAAPAPEEKSSSLNIYRQAIATIGDIILLSDRGDCDDIKEAVRGVLYMVFAATEGK